MHDPTLLLLLAESGELLANGRVQEDCGASDKLWFLIMFLFRFMDMYYSF